MNNLLTIVSCILLACIFRRLLVALLTATASAVGLALVAIGSLLLTFVGMITKE